MLRARRLVNCSLITASVRLITKKAPKTTSSTKKSEACTV
jgi:hypothetical protein